MAQTVRCFPGSYRVLRLAPRTAESRIEEAAAAMVSPVASVERHEFMTGAIDEAKLLNDQFPDSTFLVIRELARVKTTHPDAGDA